MPRYDPHNPNTKDYQRDPSPSRISKTKDRLLADIKSCDVFVDSVNLNLRLDKSKENLFVKPIIKKSDGIGDVFELDLPEEYKFFLVDGQTRLRGLEQAIATRDPKYQSKQISELENIYISFNLTVTEDHFKEGYVFFLINKHAKNIPPEGASKLIYNGSKAGDIYFNSEIKHLPNAQREIDWMDAANLVYTNSKIWGPLIKDYNHSSPGRIITIRAISNSLISQFYETVDINYKKSQKKGSISKPVYQIVSEIFEAFWKGIGIVFNDFDSKQYMITKASNGEVMCKILNYILQLHFNGYYTLGNVLDEKEYAKLFGYIFNTHREVNGMGKTVGKADLWRTGKTGAMGKYTSAAAKNELYENLRKVMVTQLNKKPGVQIPV